MAPEYDPAYQEAYDAVLARWPVAPEPVDLPSAYGTTRVHVTGPAGATPLVLLPGGGATSTVWFDNIGVLSRRHRVYAIDVIGEPGRTVHSGRSIDTNADVIAWLDTTLDALGIGHADVCGHSYGGWLALVYALHAPQRVRRLALLDPTTCFTGFRPSYLLRALPLLVKATPARAESLLRWETAGIPVDPAWRRLYTLGATHPRTVKLLPRRPGAAHLGTLRIPTLVAAAGRSRALHPQRLAAKATASLPDVRVTTLAGASHHSMPGSPAGPLNDVLAGFLD